MKNGDVVPKKPIKLPDSVYWRYKKKIAPKDDSGIGPVKIIEPRKTG